MYILIKGYIPFLWVYDKISVLKLINGGRVNKPNCENIDICILLSNLIDNAIEACEKSERPEISLTMSKQMNYYSIYIENSISNEILKDNPNLITTKNDKSIHGLGTKSIENIVNSYQGLFEYVEENGKFICNILLKDIENK